MATIPAIDCTTWEYNAWRGVAIVLFLVVVLVIPIFIFLRVQQRRSIIINENKVTTHTDSDNRFFEVWGVLFEPYRPKYWFWEIIVILGRRIVMIAFNTGLALEPMYKYLVFTWFHAGTLWVQWKWEPLVDRFDNQLEMVSICLLTLLSSLLIVEASPYSTGVQVVIFFIFPVPGVLLLLAIVSKKIRIAYERYLTKRQSTTSTFRQQDGVSGITQSPGVSMVQNHGGGPALSVQTHVENRPPTTLQIDETRKYIPPTYTNNQVTNVELAVSDTKR